MTPAGVIQNYAVTDVGAIAGCANTGGICADPALTALSNITINSAGNYVVGLISGTTDINCPGSPSLNSLSCFVAAAPPPPVSTPAPSGGGAGGGGLDNQPPYFLGGGPWSISPEDKANGNGDTPFVWKILTDLDGDTVTYYFYACSGADFADCKLIDTVVGNGDQNHRIAYSMGVLGASLVAPDELDRAKAQAQDNLKLSYESLDSRMSQIAGQIAYHGRFFSMDQILEEINAVTAEDIRALAVTMFGDPKLFTKLVVGPDGARRPWLS